MGTQKLLKKKFNRKKIKKLINKVHANDKKENNPFERNFIKNKDNHGKNKGRVSLKRADEKRKDTLLVEYKKRHNVNKTVYLRIGGNQMIDNVNSSKRLIKEKQKQSKGRMYNLNDDEHLTHSGNKLSEMLTFEKLKEHQMLEDSDDINADIVSKLHFGGFDGQDRKAKGQDKTFLQEMISMSKKEKYEKQKEKESLEEFRDRLDQTWKELRTMVKSSYNKSDTVGPTTSTDSTNESISKSTSTKDEQQQQHPFLKKMLDKPKKKEVDEPYQLESYDAIFRSLQFESVPTVKKSKNPGTEVQEKSLPDDQAHDILSRGEIDKGSNKVMDKKNKKYQVSYSADALSYDECCDPRLQKGEQLSNTTSGLEKPYTLAYDKDGRITSSLVEKIFSTNDAHNSQSGEKITMALASAYVKALRLDFTFLKLNAVNGVGEFNRYIAGQPSANEEEAKRVGDELAHALDSEAVKFNRAAVGKMADAMIVSTRYLVDSNMTLRNGSGLETSIYGPLGACKSFVGRPNVVQLIISKLIAALANRITYFRPAAACFKHHPTEGILGVHEGERFPGHKLFAFTYFMVRMIPYLGFDPTFVTKKLASRLVHLMALTLGHLAVVLRSLTNPPLLAYQLGCRLINELSGPIVRYFPEGFAFLASASFKSRDLCSYITRDGEDSGLQIETLKLLLQTTRHLMDYYCPGLDRDAPSDAKPEFHQVLSCLPETLDSIGSGLENLAENCPDSGQLAEIKTETLLTLSRIRAVVNVSCLNRSRNRPSPGGPESVPPISYPRLLEPLIQPPKASWKRQQRQNCKEAGEEGYYLATAQNLAERKRLKHMVKRDFKTAKKELRKDARFLANQQLREQMERDTNRKLKVKRLYAILADQEGECRALKKKKIKPRNDD